MQESKVNMHLSKPAKTQLCLGAWDPCLLAASKVQIISVVKKLISSSVGSIVMHKDAKKVLE